MKELLRPLSVLANGLVVKVAKEFNMVNSVEDLI